MGYLSIIGEENLKNCFSAKQITVLNNKKAERKLYVVTNKDEFPDKPFKNDLFETVFYFATDEITEKVEGEFKDIIKRQQEELNYLLWGKNYESPQPEFSFIKNLKLNNINDDFIKHFEKSSFINSAKSSKKLIQKAQNAISNTYKEIQKAIESEVTAKRRELIENLASKNFSEITQALQIYIGNYAYTILEFMCEVAVFDKEIPKNHMSQFKIDFEKIYLDQLLDGAIERNIFALMPQGGIKPFMDFIKECDVSAYKELNNHIEKTLSIVLKPLTLTPKEKAEIFGGNVSYYDKKTSVSDEIQSKIIQDISSHNLGFAKIFQNNPLNAVAHTSQKNLKINNSIMKATNRKYEVQVTLSLDKLPNLNLNVPTHKVLDSLMLKLTKQLPSGESISLEKIHKARKVSLNVNEYMNLCGIKDRTTARKQLNEAVNTIYNLSLDWSEKRYSAPEGKKKKTLEEKKYSIRILDSKSETISENPVKNGAVEVNFTYEIAEYLARRSSFIMWYSEDILKINSKLNPHSYYMMRLFLEHNNRNIAGKNANRISVKTLIDACPDLPLYDDVMQKYQGHITQKIIDPIERDLDALVKKYKILKNWQYCNSNGAPLTKGQLYQYDYETWIKWLIEFEFPDTFPDQTERIKKIQER